MDCSDKKECREKKAAIIQATVELVGEHGFHGAPMAMVAERAGVAAGTIYRYFENKDALITGTYKDLEERLQAKVLQGFPEQGTPREKFFHFARVLVKWWIASPVDFRFVEQFHNSPYGVAQRRDKLLGKQRNLCWDIFHEALEQQGVKDLPLPILFGLTFGPLILISRDHNHGFIALDDTMIEQTIEGCWNAVKR
ncbi:TetR/AcrR family transcriptional regulator [Geomonas sp.]|uniref:TetR/AcrR family transcriptional regulator n=1 Tax=Geomonas sp. TaxID=2651584 RepID=UPI002B4760D0|nr:TetR/AcrR family transcriptional regulator [Geomonas sp.]HJV34081.1 TetR/AcrR family transcriptional regulator [Geomonas sp.]